MGHLETMIGRINIRTQVDISELREVVELIQNRSEENSLCVSDLPPFDSAAITHLESDIQNHELRIIAMHRAISDEKIYVRERTEEIDVIKSGLIESKQINNKLREQIQENTIDLLKAHEIGDRLNEEITQMNDSLVERLHEITSDLVHTKTENRKLTAELNKIKSNQVNRKLTVELLEVKAKLMKMQNNQAKQVEKSKAEILGLRQIIMDMQQKKTEISTAITMTTQHETTTEPLPCPTGWENFQNKCYLFEEKPLTWYRAKDRCADHGAHLSEPDTQEKFQYLWKNSEKRFRYFMYTWIGGTDGKTEGTWIWSGSGRRLVSSLWAPGEPHYDDRQDCLILSKTGWHDGYCDSTLSYICEK